MKLFGLNLFGKPKEKLVADEYIHPSQIVDRYKDYKECGAWCTIDKETMECTGGGKMYIETVKFKSPDGKIKLGWEWVSDQNIDNIP